MSMRSPIAPVMLDSVDVVSSESMVLPDLPENPGLGLSVDFDNDGLDLTYDEEWEVYEMDVPLTVECNLTDEKDREDVSARFKVTVVASLSVSESLFDGIDEGDRGDMAFDYLRMNGVSMAYGHARAFILAVSAMSPTGRVTIPPVLPGELIEAASGDADS